MKDRFDNNMILYRPVGLPELELIYDGGMKTFPARLPQQPIFYPVLQLEYARQIAADWNTKSGQSAGYVTQFKIDDQYIDPFEKHTVGGTQHQEFWIPAEEVEEFNKHIIGHIKVVEAYFGDSFQGFVPDQFALQGKNAVDQFTLLANSYIYKRMDFYLEIKRNHKAVFLNYPFWLEHEFKNPGLKEKIIKAIREAWIASFPKFPLPNPVAKEKELTEQAGSDPLVNPIPEDVPPVKPTLTRSLTNPTRENLAPLTPENSKPLMSSLKRDVQAEQPDSTSLGKNLHESIEPVRETDLPSPPEPVRENIPPVKPTVSHFLQGIELGLSEKYHEAIDELSQAVQQDPKNVIAQTSLGVAFHRVDEDERALSCYEAALKLNSKYADAHYFRANILYGQGNIREAIAGYTRAVGLKPELIEAYNESTAQDRLTDYTQSPAEMYWIATPARRILNLNKSLETNPRQANLLKERATAYYRLWNYEQAIADFSAALAIQPDDAGVLHYRGLSYEQIGQLDRALEDYQQAIAIDPQLSNVYINRGVTLGKMGNYRQSIVSLSEGIRLAPQNPDGYFNRGMTYFQLGDLDSAIDDFSNVIRIAPDDADAYYWRGISHEEAGHQDEATADYQHFLEVSQNPRAREEIEQRLSQWNEPGQDTERNRPVAPDDRQEPNHDLDLYDLLVVLGERALNSTWFGSDVNCYGERSNELYAFSDHNKPIRGADLLDIASGIYQTIDGDFTAFAPGADVHWLLIRAWHGDGFYIEIDDPKSRERLKAEFQSLEQVEGAEAPYEGMFISR